MGSSLSLIHLPAQSGKTRKMTELINRWKDIIDYTDHNSGNINIIFTSNTKLLAKQTAGRICKEVDGELSDLSEDESTISIDMDIDISEKESKTIAWISNSNKTIKKKTVADVFMKITSDDDNDEINNIICCTNKIRMKNVWELLTALNKKFIKRNFNKCVNIWIDEADSCIKLWNHYMEKCEEFVESKLINKIVLISATMVPVYKHLHQVGIDPDLRTYENTHASVYHKYSESEFCHDFSVKRACTQLETILENRPEIVKAGTRLFCPGNKAKSSHEEVCDILLKQGFNVLILNGEHKEIRFCDGRPVIKIADLLEVDLEVSKTLNRLYHDNELSESPFAVTGNLCIGRGITFASQIDGREFIFTHGIIPEVANGDEGYQMVARCCGNIKEYATYKEPKIYVSQKTHELILQQENLAVEFAKKIFKDDEENPVEPTIKVTREMLKNAIGKDAAEERREKKEEKVKNLKFIIGDTNEFASLDEANTFCMKIKKGAHKEKEESFMNEEGDFVCTTTKKGAKKFTYEDFMQESAGWNASSLLNMDDLMKGKVSKVIKPVYRGDEVVWLVRWAVHVGKAEGIMKNGFSDNGLSSCKIQPIGQHKFILLQK